MTYDIGTNVMITRKRANKQQGKTNPLKTTGKPWKTTPSKALSRWWWFRGWYPQNCRSERIKIFMLLDADWKLRRMFPNKSTYIQYLSWFHTVAIFAWQTTLISVFFIITSLGELWVNYKYCNYYKYYKYSLSATSEGHHTKISGPRSWLNGKWPKKHKKT